MGQPSTLSILAESGFRHAVQLGSGAYGEVYRCTAPDGRAVAVKISFDDGRAAAAREAESLAAIPAHPNVMSLLSFSETPAYSMMVLPLATGGDTLKFMQDRGSVPLTEDDARPMFLQMVSALSHLHRNGFIHRDIKCENIFLTGPQRRDILLGDFGFVGRWRAGELLDQAWGSIHYSSPEIIAQTTYEGPEVDVWSLGVVLYAWCSGRLPFGGATDAETGTRILSGRYTLPDTISPELRSLLHGVLEVNPAMRLTLDDIRKHPWVLTDGSDDAYFAMRRLAGSGSNSSFFPAIPTVVPAAAHSARGDMRQAMQSPKRRASWLARTILKRLFRDDINES